MKRLGNLVKNFVRKQRISVINPHSGKESWHIMISPLKVVMVLLSTAILMLIGIAALAMFTSVLDLIPGYHGNKSHKELLASIEKLDSLNRRLDMWQVYYDNLTTIMEGRTPQTVASAAGDSTLKIQADSIERLAEDSILRRQVELEQIYKLNEQEARKISQRNIQLISPTKGMIISRFNSEAGTYGVEVKPLSDKTINAVNDGIVILSTWAPSEGYLLYILHSDNYISVYKHYSPMTKRSGERVKAGDVLGYTGVSKLNSTKQGIFKFELWYNGTPVNPENYLTFE
ncbi:MAG: M23 family metallopeptidase [Rikenellaceae bacterium]|nr:M23 family metallopeptidase [Rikenellaceae bacterium]